MFKWDGMPNSQIFRRLPSRSCVLDPYAVFRPKTDESRRIHTIETKMILILRRFRSCKMTSSMPSDTISQAIRPCRMHLKYPSTSYASILVAYTHHPHNSYRKRVFHMPYTSFIALIWTHLFSLDILIRALPLYMITLPSWAHRLYMNRISLFKTLSPFELILESHSFSSSISSPLISPSILSPVSPPMPSISSSSDDSATSKFASFFAACLASSSFPH